MNPARIIVVAAGLLTASAALAAAAGANHGPLPWVGGLTVNSAFELRAGEVAGDISGTPTRVICNGHDDWHSLAAKGDFDPDNVWGYVETYFDRATYTWKPRDYIHLSEQACWYLDEFAGGHTPQKDCQAGTRTEIQTQTRTEKSTEYRTEVRTETQRFKVRKRVKVRGRFVSKLVTVTKTRKYTVEVPYDVFTDVDVDVEVQVPVYTLCPDYIFLLFSITTLAHEAIHVRGIGNEASAECYAMQWFAATAYKLGGPGDPREMASQYWTEFYLKKRPGGSYFSSDCVDGGRLDLSPGNPGWPTLN